jgi:hypothetical protein
MSYAGQSPAPLYAIWIQNPQRVPKPPAMSYAGQSPAPLYAIWISSRARRNTDRIMSGVSFFVFVFWRLGW